MTEYERLLDIWPLNQLPDWPPTWWICGGVALGIHLNCHWRPHADVDIALRPVRRTIATIDRPPSGAPSWAIDLRSWVMATREATTAAPFRVQSPTGLPLEFRMLWVTDDVWRPSGLPEPEVPWREAILRSPSKVPYLAPELVLLLKSRHPRPRDDLDARALIPKLGPTRQARLQEWLSAGHPWRLISPLA